MLRRTRTSRAARLALWLAAALALATSFGLHPEPSGAFGPPSGAAAWTKARIGSPEAAHGCLACLAHGTALSSPAAGVVFDAALAEFLSLPLDPISHRRPAGDDRSGRSPPFGRS